MDAEFFELFTKQGKLKGLVKKSAGVSQKTYYSFQGIPYARPPIGDLRFKLPVPYGEWEGVRDATKEGNDAIQNHMFFGNPTGDEDCLYLNVYTTQTRNEGVRKAVMVWIHGGGFTRGSGSTELYGPDFFIEEDVVVVTINYRCGVLGFLSLKNDKLPGNLGLKDQVLALKWVQDNIDSFGGDPNNVTIFGQSAGGASVHYHLLSPLSRGLFHKAILQSGTSLSQWAFQEKPKEKALLLAKELGCTSQDPDTVLEFLMSVPASELVTAQHKETLRTEKDRIHKLSLIFTPCVEVAGDTSFLTDTPKKLMENGNFAKVPIIMGVTNKEGMFCVSHKLIPTCAILSMFVPCDLAITPGCEEELKLGREILQFYGKTDTFSWEIVHEYVDFITDVGFAVGLENSRQYFLQHGASIYSYLFTYTSPRAFSSFLIPKAFPDKAEQFVGTGASHGDDLAFLFKTNMSQVPFIPPTVEDQTFMKKLLKTWTTFAKTGNPNCEELGVTWTPDNEHNPCYLEIGKIFKQVDEVLFPERMKFWKNIYVKYSLPKYESARL